MNFPRKSVYLAAVLGCASLQGVLGAQATTTTPAQRFDRIREINSLDFEGAKPWHLKLHFTVLDSLGAQQFTGNIEEWWRDSKNRKLVFTQSDGKTATFLSVDGKRFQSGPAAHIPSRVDLLLKQFVHPVAPALPQAMPVLLHHDFGKIATDCIMLSQTTKGEQTLGTFPTYCVGEDDALRLAWLLRTITLASNKPAKFQGHFVPLEAIVTFPGVGSMRGEVEDLRTIPLSDIDLSTTGLVPSIDASALVSSGVVAGMKVSGLPPEYPMAARDHRSAGTVLLKVTIGKDGHIEEVEPLSSPDAILTGAAMNAVKQWVYKPYLLKGEPVQVDTTIEINFNLGGRGR